MAAEQVVFDVQTMSKITQKITEISFQKHFFSESFHFWRRLCNIATALSKNEILITKS
jgi:hypothetical protein